MSGKIKTALISVSDKAGLAEFAKELHKNGVKIISSGGTYDFLAKNGIKAVKVEDVTGFPEMLGGRVKTLHPKLHGGILAKRTKEHLAQIAKHGIGQIDLVVVNLYPFRETVSKPKVSREEAVENIDIGGPSLIRGAAKNHEYVGVVVEPAQYAKVLEDLKKNGFALSKKMKEELMAEAFAHTAAYDALIARHFAPKEDIFPSKLTLTFEKASEPRYGENPHQLAAVYKEPLSRTGVLMAEQLNGKQLSYNNILDTDAALAIAREFEEPCVVIVKHNNPCGVACDKKISNAFAKALESDTKSAFGGIIALNSKCDLETAKAVNTVFFEVIIAPDFESAALEELKKKQNLRVLKLKNMREKDAAPVFRQVEGGLLVQEEDSKLADEWKNVSEQKAETKALDDLKFAWKVAKFVKSNAIVLAKDNATVGIGMGLTSRVDASELALKKAGAKAKGSAMASDGFFPFSDSIELAAKAGVAAVCEPGGSVKDEEVIASAKKLKLPLYFTGVRHFRH
ncbi:MAG TPA: bifunctional phosphoribosylaminoimidazolecarboxamide formyltransferase/IMP cyclohydrolase [archaeon]|nr:bifunctional phosphoribosylaminoimidazolecarboxamide formyltransferase/IMP cyclohydrolase [archaeon]